MNSNYQDRTSNILINNASTISGGSSFDLIPVVRAAFIPDSRVHPFVEGGIGLSQTALKIRVTPGAGHVWADTGTREQRTVVDASQTGAALLLGGGVDFFINPGIFFIRGEPG